jgi:hypothetical protein
VKATHNASAQSGSRVPLVQIELADQAGLDLGLAGVGAVIRTEELAAKLLDKIRK